MKCIVDQSDYSGEEDAPQTGYYQWVTFFFAIQVFNVGNQLIREYCWTKVSFSGSIHLPRFILKIRKQKENVKKPHERIILKENIGITQILDPSHETGFPILGFMMMIGYIQNCTFYNLIFIFNLHFVRMCVQYTNYE